MNNKATIRNNAYLDLTTSEDSINDLAKIDQDLRHALAVCNFNLNIRIKNAIKANLFKDVDVLVPQQGAFSIAKLGEDCILTDNRDLRITSAKNILEKLGNFINNVTMLIKEKYGII